MTATIIQPLEVQYTISKLREWMAEHPPEDKIIILQEAFRYSKEVRYDLFHLDDKLQEGKLIQKWECSHFCDHLLGYLGVPFPSQTKGIRIDTLCDLLGISKSDFYSIPGKSTKGTTQPSYFLMLVGLILHYHAHGGFSNKVTPEILENTGNQGFDIILDYLNYKYGELYDAGKLPQSQAQLSNADKLTPELLDRYPKMFKQILTGKLSGESNVTMSSKLKISKQMIAKWVKRANKFHNMVCYGLELLDNEDELNPELLTKALASKFPILEPNRLQSGNFLRGNDAAISLRTVMVALGVELAEDPDAKRPIDVDAIVSGYSKFLETTCIKVTPSEIAEGANFDVFALEVDFEKVQATYLWALDELLRQLLTDDRDNKALSGNIRKIKSRSGYKQKVKQADDGYFSATISQSDFNQVFGMYVVSVVEPWRLLLYAKHPGAKFEPCDLVAIGSLCFPMLLGSLESGEAKSA